MTWRPSRAASATSSRKSRNDCENHDGISAPPGGTCDQAGDTASKAAMSSKRRVNMVTTPAQGMKMGQGGGAKILAPAASVRTGGC